MGADDFITRDSGKQRQYKTGMKRDSQKGKPQFALITPLNVPYENQMLTRWAALMTRGAEKYDARNWENAGTKEEMLDYVDSAERHLQQWKAQILGYGFANEEMMKEDHAAAVYFNIQGAEYIKWKLSQTPTAAQEVIQKEGVSISKSECICQMCNQGCFSCGEGRHARELGQE